MGDERLALVRCRLHEGQRKVFLSTARIRVLACGARWGKDRLGIIDMIVKASLMSREPQRSGLIPRVLCWYVAPTNNLLRQSWAEAEFFLQGTSAKFNLTQRRIRLQGGIELEFKSADTPGALLARGLDLIVVTEAARMKREAWEQGLVTRLTSPGRGPFGLGGIAMLNSTPEGQNWYYDLYRAALADSTGYMEAFHFTSYDNPYIRREELDRQKDFLPQAVFAQEYLAEFINNNGTVFRNLRDAFVPYLYPCAPDKDGDYCIGIDWGRHGDATAVAIVQRENAKFKLANFCNLQNRTYSEQIGYIRGLITPYTTTTARARIIAESNSIGDPLIEQLEEALNSKVIRFRTTAATKRGIIENAIMLFEQGRILLPAVNSNGYQESKVPLLTEELTSFASNENATGVTFAAPKGKHDDSVMALCLALCEQTRSGEIMKPLYFGTISRPAKTW